MHKLTNAHGSVLYIPRTKEAQQVQAFLDRQPRVLPQGPTRPRYNVVSLLARLLLLLVLALVIAATFFLFGEERPESVVRPLLTAAQRSRAFRL